MMQVHKLTEQYLDGTRTAVEMALMYLNSRWLTEQHLWRVRLAKWLLKPLPRRGW